MIDLGRRMQVGSPPAFSKTIIFLMVLESKNYFYFLSIMNKKIKLKLFVTLIVIAVGFLANTASLNAQTEVAECDKATLYGAVFVGTYPRNAWFEWGTTSSLGQSTQKQLFYTNSSYSDTISPLNENTTYYWRAVSREVTRTGTGSTDYGNILSFRTPRCGDDEPGDVTATATATATATETVTCSDGSIKSGTATASASASATARTFEQAHAIALQRAYDIALANARTQARTIANSKCLIIIDDDDGERPDVTTRSATSISRTGARLNGRTSGNGLVTRSWFEYGRDIDNLNSETARRTTGSGTLDFTESISGLREDTTYYFRAVAENNEGEDRGSIFSFRTDEDDDDDSSELIAVTTPATLIFSSSAQLNALILSSGSDDIEAWFEWGPTPNMTGRTNAVRISSGTSVRHLNFVTGLAPGVTYYFRAIAENSETRSIGVTLTFTTPAIITPPPTTPTTPPVVVVSGNTTRNNLVMLTIDGGSEFITANEQREYKVEWENISNQTLRNVVLRVLVPESMDFEVANAGIVSQDGNTLSLDIGNLEREEEGELSFLARTKDFLRDGETLVVVANLVYTDRNDTQNDVLAYATHTAYANGEVLGASVFSAGFLPNSLFEWLLLIIFILILALLGKHLINQNRPSTSPEGH